jgi:hypothetical protein
VLGIARPPRQVTATWQPWEANELRKSPYLVPSNLGECDVKELWVLGDREHRHRPPEPWMVDEPDVLK